MAWIFGIFLNILIFKNEGGGEREGIYYRKLSMNYLLSKLCIALTSLLKRKQNVKNTKNTTRNCFWNLMTQALQRTWQADLYF